VLRPAGSGRAAATQQPRPTRHGQQVDFARSRAKKATTPTPRRLRSRAEYTTTIIYGGPNFRRKPNCFRPCLCTRQAKVFSADTNKPLFLEYIWIATATFLLSASNSDLLLALTMIWRNHRKPAASSITITVGCQMCALVKLSSLIHLRTADIFLNHACRF
jgi:hypothetical protein